MKFFGAAEWRFAAFNSATTLPFTVLTTVLLVDVIDWFEKSDQLLPISSAMIYFFMWFIFNIPAVYYASYAGFVSSHDKAPCQVSLVRRPIPAQPWYLAPVIAYSVPSLIMFSTIISELHYIITSTWRSYIMGMYLFLFLNMNLMLSVVGIVSIIMTYLRLRACDWSWWWPAFF